MCSLLLVCTSYWTQSGVTVDLGWFVDVTWLQWYNRWNLPFYIHPVKLRTTWYTPTLRCLYDTIPVSKKEKNIYRSDAQVTFMLYSPFRCLHAINSKYYYIYQALSYSVGFKAPFEIHWVRPYLENFTGVADIVNATVLKTAPTFTGLGHSKLS